MPATGGGVAGCGHQPAGFDSVDLNTRSWSLAEEPVRGRGNGACRCGVCSTPGTVVIIIILRLVSIIATAMVLSALMIFIIVVAGQDGHAATCVIGSFVRDMAEGVGDIWANGCARCGGHNRTDGGRGKEGK